MQYALAVVVQVVHQHKQVVAVEQVVILLAGLGQLILAP
jgi:hypothetical protein